jgi:thioredoxin reductase (NADPH)
MKDLVIIGAGPAGLSAAIYGMRAGLDLLVVEKLSPGGLVMTTYEVENYPGFSEPVPGWELMSQMENQARRLGAEITSGDVASLTKNTVTGNFDIVLDDGRKLASRAVVYAAGASLMKLDVPGEAEFTGRGVSYCATCDGAFFKERVTAVVGGGDTALEEANFLTRFAATVYIIIRRDRFRGSRLLQDRVLSNPRIVPVYNTVITSINGEGRVESVTVRNRNTGEEGQLKVDGVFIFVGYQPNTAALPREVLNECGEVVVDMKMNTHIEGLFAAGDLRVGSIRQIVAAAADGATAALSSYEYIESLLKEGVG